MTVRYLLIAATLVLSACVQPRPIAVAQAAPTAAPVKKNALIGRSIDAAISELGQPSGVADMGNGIQAFQFKPNQKKTNCVVSYLAARDGESKPWIIEDYIAADPKTC